MHTCRLRLVLLVWVSKSELCLCYSGINLYFRPSHDWGSQLICCGHWAVARKMVDRHVSKHTTNVVSVESEEADKQPKEVYEHLLSTFSKEGDLILDIASGNGKKKTFLSCGNHYTPLETTHLMPILWFDIKHTESDKNFHESVLFKEAWYRSRVFHMETYNNHEFFNYLASTLLRRSKISVYHFCFHFQETDCSLDWVWKGHLFTLISGQRKMPSGIF